MIEEYVGGVERGVAGVLKQEYFKVSRLATHVQSWGDTHLGGIDSGK
jgi:hypothetical protein